MTPTRYVPALALLMYIVSIPQITRADQLPFILGNFFFKDQLPLFEAIPQTPIAGSTRGLASLFTGQQGTSLFAPHAAERQQDDVGAQLDKVETRVGSILQLIGQAEAGQHGYNAIQYRATRRPIKRPTEMTIGEIYEWIEKTPGQQHAIGRYQLIPTTLRRLVTDLEINLDEVYAPSLQDQLANALLAEAGLLDFNLGNLERHQLMDNMAKIWAGLPTSTGQSHYHGFAGNRATMTWEYFDSEMAKIFPS